MSPDHPDSDPVGDDTTLAEAMRAAVSRRLDPPEAERKQCAPPSIPDHRLLDRIGRGAYGEVWLAISALGTMRAVKVVYRARFNEDRPFEREFNGILKFEPVSRTHEGLVQVLHVGRNDEAGCFYYVMELADSADGVSASAETVFETRAALEPQTRPPVEAGTRYSPRTLRSELAARQRLNPPEAASLVLRLAGALAHLHAHGLVHRDIKPSNVIFVGGQPKLADIGLVTDGGSSHSFVGTEGFIPPEGPGTPQADLYGLGKLLYELATGRDRMDFPQLPPGIAGCPDGEALLELNEVMTRACAPEPRQRYARVTELQAELNLFLAGRSLRRARNNERRLARLKRFVTVACLFLVLAAGALWFAKNEERHANERARQATERAWTEAGLRQRAEAAERETQRQLYVALLEQARSTVRSGELGQRVRALDALGRAAAISNTAELRREAVAALALPDLRLELELPIGPDVTLVKLDPALERIALCRGMESVEIRSVEDQRLLTILPASTNLNAHHSEWSQDGRFLAVKRDYSSGGARADWEVWEVSGARLVLLLRDVPVGAVSFHPHRPALIVGRRTGGAAIWSLEEGREQVGFPLNGVPIQLRFAPDGQRFAAVLQTGRGLVLSVHDAFDPTAAGLAAHDFPHFLYNFAWHPGGRWLAVPDISTAVHWMDAQTGETGVLGRHKAEAVTAVFSPDGAYLFSGGWERELICWDAQTRRRAFGISLDSDTIQLSADGRRCAVRTPLGLQLHSFERPAVRRAFVDTLGGRLRYAAFSPDGRWLAASGDKRMGVWDLAANEPGAFSDEAFETRFFFTADGGELFGSRGGQSGGDCFRWYIAPATNAGGPPTFERLPLHKPGGFTSLSLGSNSVVLTGSEGSQVVALKEVGGSNDGWARTHSGINSVSPDGRWLAVFRPFTPWLYVHRLPGLERVAKLTHPSNIGFFQFSPRGDELAVYSRGGVEFWSTETWEQTRSLTNFSGVMFSPDSRAWWLTRDPRTAGLHDARTLEAWLPLPTGMLPLALSPDGRHLAVSVDAQRLQVWDLVALREELRELGLDWTEGRGETAGWR